MTPEQYCQEKAAVPGSSFYYSTLHLQKEHKIAIFALHAFRNEIYEVLKLSDPGLAKVKLQWWRNEVTNSLTGDVQHPVSKTLGPMLAELKLPADPLVEMIDNAETELDGTKNENFAALEAHCKRRSHNLWTLTTRIVGFQDLKTLEYAKHFGVAVELIKIVQNTRDDAISGRCLIPLDELTKANLTAENLVANDDKPVIENFITHQVKRAHRYYNDALAVLPDADRYSQIHTLIFGTILETTLDEIARDGYKVIEQRIMLTPLRKLFIAWRVRLRETRRRRRRV